MSRAAPQQQDRWFFYQDTANHWKWARLDVLGTVLAQADQAFDSREACVADARHSGYQCAPHLNEPAAHPVRRTVRSRAGARESRRL